MGSKSMDKSAAKFACPYAKHAPDEPYKAASYYYPGFPIVSRVKCVLYDHFTRVAADDCV